jgi:hypothetical protein
MVWLCAWLHVNVVSYTTNWWGDVERIGFLLTPYGFALIFTIVIIEVALIKYIYDW